MEGWKQEAKVHLENFSDEQVTRRQGIFSVIPTLFQQKLGLTHILQHTIHLNDPHPTLSATLLNADGAPKGGDLYNDWSGCDRAIQE